MADFKQAVEWMKEGKKIYRSDFSNSYMTSDGIENFKFVLSDFVATDWEIYEEEDNWTIRDEFERLAVIENKIPEHTTTGMDEVIVGYSESIRSHKLKTLKEKILEDITKMEYYNSPDEVSRKEVKEIISKRFGFICSKKSCEEE